MQWTETRPSTEGQHRWRERDGACIHPVRVQIRKGQVLYHCSTMDLRKVLAGGHWCHDIVETPKDERGTRQP